MQLSSDERRSREVEILSRPALWVLILALALRLAVVGLAVGWNQPPSDKSIKYDPVARSLLSGEGFSRLGRPTALSPPVYPLLLAAVYGAAGESPTAIRLALAMLDTLHCALWMQLAWSLLGRRIGLLTGLGLAVCPYFLYAIVTAGNDSFFLLLHGLFLSILVSAWRSSDIRGFAAAGVAVGVATLCRAVSLFEPLFLAPLLVACGARARRRVAGGAAVMLLFYFLSLTPWTVRNWVHFGRLIPIQANAGYTLLVSNFERRDPALWDELREAKDASHTTEDMDAGFMRQGLRLVTENPGNFVKHCLLRLVRMWYYTHSRRFIAVLALANAALLTAAGVGLVRLRHRWRELLPVLAAAAYFIAFHSLLFAIFRYMLPVVPVLVMLAAAAVQPRSELARR